MNVVLTGASGFLGTIIQDQLEQKHTVVAVGRSEKSDIRIKDLTEMCDMLQPNHTPEMVVHAAGLAHQNPKNEKEKQRFKDVNFTGTKCLCKWIDNWSQKPKVFVFISSVAVYGVTSGTEISEDYPLNGGSPYADSKIEAEKLVMEWGKKNNVLVLILRLPLLVGPNPPGNLGKMISSIKSGMYFSINKGKARKSAVLASDVANLISNGPFIGGIYNLTDGYHPSFAELELAIATQLGKPRPYNMPLIMAKILGLMGDILTFLPFNTATINKIVLDLTFSDIKAQRFLGWKPKRVIDHISQIKTNPYD
jgi:nucleoside-diphosphate-sugar epimerase